MVLESASFWSGRIDLGPAAAEAGEAAAAKVWAAREAMEAEDEARMEAEAEAAAHRAVEMVARIASTRRAEAAAAARGAREAEEAARLKKAKEAREAAAREVRETAGGYAARNREATTTTTKVTAHAKVSATKVTGDTAYTTPAPAPAATAAATPFAADADAEYAAYASSLLGGLSAGPCYTLNPVDPYIA
jgi:hypothetical protein